MVSSAFQQLRSAFEAAATANTVEADHTPRPAGMPRFKPAAASRPAVDETDNESEGYQSARSATLTSTASNTSIASHRAELRTAVRIKVSTPMHRRIRSDVSAIDPFLLSLSNEAQPPLPGTEDPGSRTPREASSSSSSSTTTPSSYRSSPSRRRANTTSLTRQPPAAQLPSIRTSTDGKRRSRSASLMASISENDATESSAPRLINLRVTKDAYKRDSSSSCTTTGSSSSPHTDLGHETDWASFIDNGYGGPLYPGTGSAASTPATAYSVKSLPPITDKLPLPTIRRPSASLAEHDEWLQEELARCSSDEEGPEPLSDREQEKFSTPAASPMGSSKARFISMPGAEASNLLGLGLDPTPRLPSFSRMQSALASEPLPIPERSSREEKRVSSDTLLEQVALHEACVEALNSLSKDERKLGGRGRSSSATSSSTSSTRSTRRNAAPSSHRSSIAPPHLMPQRRSSLLHPKSSRQLRHATSTGDFSSTVPESADLFDDGHSPSIADIGHGSQTSFVDASIDAIRRPSTSDSIDSGSSHTSSLLGVMSHSMERGASFETNVSSTRPSSIASSSGESHPARPPKSPRRINLPLEPVPQGSDDFADADESRRQGHTELLSPKRTTRALRKAGVRRKSDQRPSPPVRMTSLDNFVAAAPGTDYRSRSGSLLGDWMSEDDDARSVSISPLAELGDGPLRVPGLGEIVPPSPDVEVEVEAADKEKKEREKEKENRVPKLRGMHSDVSLSERAQSPTTSRIAGTFRQRLAERLGNSREAILRPSSRLSLREQPVSPKTIVFGAQGLTAHIAEPRHAPSAMARFIRGGASKAAAFQRNSVVVSAAPAPTPAPPATVEALPTAWQERLQQAQVRRPSSSLSMQRERERDANETFLELSESEDEDYLLAGDEGPRPALGMRKDLRKIFGASEVDLAAPTAALSLGVPERWTASLGRSSSRRRPGLW